uniref:Exodeoxyribonuclease 8 n=1 Tax=Dulem virus 40 TaxID=3145758 RepID=A0AAU8AW76_9CAUD
MTDPVIHGLSNEAYHHKAPYSEYLSSSQLKLYLKSPKAAKFALDNPEEEKSDALRFGSLFHDLMAVCAERYDRLNATAIAEWESTIAVFDPPKNDKTGQPYGNTTKAYSAAYEAFLQANEGKLIASQTEIDTIKAMAQSLMFDSGATSEQVRKALRYGKPEVSHFAKYEGCKFKFRPDLTTRYKRRGRQCADLYDWKSVATDDLSEESINRIILKYGYHISASHYQFFYHEQTGIWPGFVLVLVSKVAPHDCVMVDMCNYGYRYYSDIDMVVPGPGALEFKKLLDLHIKCTKENHWPGAEQAIPDNNGVRILEIQPPRYYSNKFIEEI